MGICFDISKPHAPHVALEDGILFPQLGHIASISTVAGLKHMTAPFCLPD